MNPPLNETMVFLAWLTALLAAAVAVYGVTSQRVSAHATAVLHMARVAAVTALVVLTGLITWCVAVLAR
ncbi:hypothetical protein ACTMSW_08785 [Micromonospora sp. BQ11]|uniref:hypothetical protein n=1 Tax=Micromonospora sp. BQ11 TaxID=3452212 RepID=UPI003F88C11C